MRDKEVMDAIKVGFIICILITLFGGLVNFEVTNPEDPCAGWDDKEECQRQLEQQPDIEPVEYDYRGIPK